MSSHALVCEYDASLVPRLRKRDLVLRLEDLDAVTDTVRAVREHCGLAALWLRPEAPLSDLSLSGLGGIGDVPVYLEVPSLGPFREWLGQVAPLRRQRFHIALPEEAPSAYRDLRILSSLHVSCGIVFGERQPDWESLADLMAYALYTKVPHAPIEPFHFVVSRYEPDDRVDFGRVTFEDPSRFLHIDVEGRIALSRKELERGEFVAETPEQLDGAAVSDAVRQRQEAWRELFLAPGPCASCPGFRLCLGKFLGFAPANSGCRDFFVEFMEAVEARQERNGKDGEPSRIRTERPA